MLPGCSCPIVGSKVPLEGGGEVNEYTNELSVAIIGKEFLDRNVCQLLSKAPTSITKFIQHVINGSCRPTCCRFVCHHQGRVLTGLSLGIIQCN
jgi:hypothetical protein